jgi:HSP20 family molecular chaperone IbpA
MKEKRSFFERLTGTVKIDDELEPEQEEQEEKMPATHLPIKSDWGEDESEGELTVDVFQTADDIVIKAMVSGMDPNELDISIGRDTVTIKGKREGTREVVDDDYFCRELYWGSFSRTIALPQEIEVEEAEATQKHGLLTIKLPKIDKRRQAKLRVKSL